MKSHALIYEIFGIVVIYKQSIEDSVTLKTINQAVPKGEILDLLVFDNSPERQEADPSLYSRIRMTYVHNPENPGLSYAYNYGASVAMTKKKSWILILDQDTVFPENLFVEFEQNLQHFPSIKLFAPILKLSDGNILSPCKFTFRGSTVSKIEPGIHSLMATSPVNSGMIINLNAFMKVKGYNEKVKLDLSDHQFIERFKNHFNEYVVLNAVGKQDFSDMNDNLGQQITRFKFYREGTLRFETNNAVKKCLLILYLLVRAVKKSIKYKSMTFLKVLFEETK